MANPRQSKKRVHYHFNMRLIYLAVIESQADTAHQAEAQENSRSGEQSCSRQLE